MEWTVVLLLVGAVGVVVLAVVAIRGSFRDDDAFYGGSPGADAGRPTHDLPVDAETSDSGGAVDGGRGDGAGGGSG
jgi:hypothetical protein